MLRSTFVRLASGCLLAVPLLAISTAPSQVFASPLGCVPESGVGLYGTYHNVAAETNTYSRWVIGAGTVALNESTTTTVGITISASFETDVSILVASVKATFGVSVNASVAKASSYNYSFPVPSGTEKRIMVWHKSLGVEVGNWSVANSCVYHWTNLSWMYVPYSSTDNSTYEVGLQAYPGATIKSWP